MSNRWPMDYSWQDGHHPDRFTYDLRADVVPAEAAQAAYAQLGPDTDGGVVRGGAVAHLTGAGEITATSHGQDACDSLSDLADAIVDATEAVDPSVRITWTQLPPRSDDDGAAAVWVDGYWIPADEAAGYEARRDRLVARLQDAVGDAADTVRVETIDGQAVATGRRQGTDVFSLLLGSMQLDMMEEADADGTLRDYALGDT